MGDQTPQGRRSPQSLLMLMVLVGGLTFGPPGPLPVSGQAVSGPLLAAVLPSSRSALVGTPVTAFVAVINTGSVTIQGVGAFLKTPIAATLTFQTTDPATNVPTGTPNAPVNLGPGATQTFVIALTPTAAFPPTIVEFDFSGTEHVATIPGVNTLLVSASSVPTPDFVALAATTSNNGILEASVSGAVATAFATLGTQQGVVLRHRGAFAVAATNVGAPGVLTATARNTGSGSVALAVQETDPATGAVIGGNVKSMASGQTATFAVFALGTSVPFDPAANRVVVEFLDDGGVIRGSSSVALTTRRGDLIAQGANLFFNERFNGNGRTCATCHPADNNFTLDPAFIAQLPPDDPLFVAETNPALAGLENSQMLRQFALVTENVDGFDKPGILRAVPHTLALPTSVQSFAGPRTGWSGDGAPGDGSLSSFATGAVTQHFPRSLNRVPGVDFRLPTPAELGALEAFQLSLGRQSDPVLPLPLKGAAATSGQGLFLNNFGKCSRCHVNGGANADFGAGSLGNDNFDTGVESFAPQPPRPPGQVIPPDGGFGRDPRPSGLGFGNGQFNTPPLVEAADTPPFFHNNSVQTIEDAVAFYNSAAFNNSSGAIVAGGNINLTPPQVTQVAAFLRVLNALENIRSATEMLGDAQSLTTEPALLTRLLALASKDLGDAIKVLDDAGLHPDAVSLLRDAQTAAGQQLIAIALTDALAARALLIDL
jgi:mono/diheme cytochrome c family protein